MSGTRYPVFDREAIIARPLRERGHELTIGFVAPLSLVTNDPPRPELHSIRDAIRRGRAGGSAVILMLGAHPIKLGLSRFIVDLIERRWVTHVATNGAGIIHDFELALVGGTSEDVAKWLGQGQFGLWRETSRLNEIIRRAAERDEGLGEAVGRVIQEESFPHRELSICAAGWRAGTPVTSHVTIGGDIIHALPNCDGAALGKTSYLDFLIFSHGVSRLEGGVFLNVGSAVTGPEVFLKALSMTRNVARQQGRQIRDFTTAVFDLVQLPEDYRDGPPGKEHPLYYYRPWKTLLCRTVSGGGRSFYIRGDHRQTIPALWRQLVESESRSKPDHVANS